MDPQNNARDAAALGVIVLDVDLQGGCPAEITVRIANTGALSPAGFLKEVALALGAAADRIEKISWDDIETYQTMLRGSDTLKILRMRGVR